MTAENHQAEQRRRLACNPLDKCVDFRRLDVMKIVENQDKSAAGRRDILYELRCRGSGASGSVPFNICCVPRQAQDRRVARRR